jgi:hypothetical protein
MRITRRRKRFPDPFASPDWVRSVFDQLKSASPLLSSLKEKDLIKLAHAIRHVERYSATDTKRGRPSRWPREDMVRMSLKLSELLRRETSGRLSLATFVDHYLRILVFPADVLEPLCAHNINLFEAEQLARITSRRLDDTSSAAKQKRQEILRVHLQSKESGERLRRRVNELLNGSALGLARSVASDSEINSPENLEDFDPYDTTHLLFEEIKRLGFAFREIRREDLTDELIEELLQATQPVWAILAKIQRQGQKSSARRLTI